MADCSWSAQCGMCKHTDEHTAALPATWVHIASFRILQGFPGESRVVVALKTISNEIVNPKTEMCANGRDPGSNRPEAPQLKQADAPLTAFVNICVVMLTTPETRGPIPHTTWELGVWVWDGGWMQPLPACRPHNSWKWGG